MRLKSMHDDETGDEMSVGIAEALGTLPLFDDLYLSMQAINLDLTDRFLIDQESDLLREYIEIERTPSFSAMFVSALSQLWIFGIYELLRTWRQRCRDVLRWHRELQAIPPNEQQARVAEKRREIEKRTAAPETVGVYFWPAYEQAATDPTFGESLRKALDRTERLFRRIEAFRVALAKHELPGVTGSFAMAPGYGRIDMTSGSISWQVVLHGQEVDRVSRREIADQCRRLAHGAPPWILPEAIQDKIKKFPKYSYGVKRVTLILDDGRQYRGVYVAWGKEVIGIPGAESIHFDAERVVDARHEPGDDDETERDETERQGDGA